MDPMGICRISPRELANTGSLTVPPPPPPPPFLSSCRMNSQKALENFDPHVWDTQYSLKQPALKQQPEAKKKQTKRWSKSEDFALTRAAQQIGEVRQLRHRSWTISHAFIRSIYHPAHIT